jgi:hypothetical protein
MKIQSRRTPPPEEPVQQEPARLDVELGTEPRAHRRTTVTVERETLSVLLRRTISEPVTASAPRTKDEQTGLESADRNLSVASPPAQNELDGGKP